jgi:hypothetical protein
MPERDQNNQAEEDRARDERIRRLRAEQEVLWAIERRQLVELESLRITKENMQRKLTCYQQHVDNHRRRRDQNNDRKDGAAT